MLLSLRTKVTNPRGSRGASGVEGGNLKKALETLADPQTVNALIETDISVYGCNFQLVGTVNLAFDVTYLNRIDNILDLY